MYNVSREEIYFIASAVEDCFAKAFRDPSQSEPQLIANLTWYFGTEFNQACKREGSRVSAGALFVHQKPQVCCSNFPDASQGACEIGDLLVVRSERESNRFLNRRALLLQAKKAKSFPVKPDSLNQQHLYSKWPTFKYVRAGPTLNGKRRHITGNDVYNGAKYLLINNGNRNTGISFLVESCLFFHRQIFPEILTAQPYQPVLKHYDCFLREVVAFILGDAGKPYTFPVPRNQRNWDRVISDLVKVSAQSKSVFVRRASAGKYDRRDLIKLFAVGVFGQLYEDSGIQIDPEDQYYNESPPKVPDEFRYDEDWGNGIPIIQFVLESEPREK